MIDPGEVRGKIENWTKVSRQHNFDTCISKHVDTHMISDTRGERPDPGELYTFRKQDELCYRL